jgi:hypothetical protein
MKKETRTKIESRAFALALATLALAPGIGRAQSAGSGAPETLAQQVVRETVALHRGRIAAVELALVSAKGCSTVAATDSKEVGESCDSDDKRPMRTGEPNVEEPTKKDPMYEVTQALHDQSGRLIGAVSMDIQPQPGQDRAGVVAFAATVLHEIEARIPSKDRLLEPAAPVPPSPH